MTHGDQIAAKADGSETHAPVISAAGAARTPVRQKSVGAEGAGPPPGLTADRSSSGGFHRSVNANFRARTRALVSAAIGCNRARPEYRSAGMPQDVIGVASDCMGNMIGFRRNGERCDDAPILFFDHDIVEVSEMAPSFDGFLDWYVVHLNGS
jgi:hypothetical protein